jgi:putative transposase
MSRETLAGEAPVALLCETFGISRAAYYASRRVRTKRDEKVVRLPSRPRYTPAEEVLAAIREVIAEQPAWGVRKVWAALRRRGMCVSRKRVWALMHEHGLVLRRDREPGEPPRGHVAVPEPNRRWASDVTTIWTKKDGVVAIVPVVDCGCRSILACAVTKKQDSPSVLAPIAAALTAVFGCAENVPEGFELRTDHGPQYTGGDAAALAKAWNLEHTFAPVGRPTGNAVAERLIRTIKEELLWQRDWEDAAEVEAAIAAYLRRYNEERPHQALDWKTPAEYRAEKLGTGPMLAERVSQAA